MTNTGDEDRTKHIGKILEDGAGLLLQCLTVVTRLVLPLMYYIFHTCLQSSALMKHGFALPSQRRQEFQQDFNLHFSKPTNQNRLLFES